MKKNAIKLASLLAITTLLSGFIVACDDIDYRMYKNDIPRYWGGDYNPFAPNNDEYFDYYEEYSKENKKSSSSNNKKSSSSNNTNGNTNSGYLDQSYINARFSDYAIKEVTISISTSCKAETINVPPTYIRSDTNESYAIIGDYGTGFTGLDATTIILPEGFKNINIGFATSMLLETVKLPSTIVSIDASILTSCYCIETIEYNGTKAQWEAINKDANWTYGLPNTITVVCKDGSITVPYDAEFFSE